MLVGQQVGPFVVDKELGSGAMGTVYRGRYAKTGQVVAIKVMAPGLGTTNSHAAERFEREMEILKQLKHPNIVRLFGIGRTHGTRYFAMEYIEGEPLDRAMARRGRLSWEEVVELGKNLCCALQHAHEKGIIHRDLKPSNLMVTKDGVLKLTDFGIAKDMDVTALTSANCTVGTAAYMSPEQCKGERDLTPKSDLYSLGVVLYELLTGAKPFKAENAMEMFLQHVQGTFTRPGRLVINLPASLDNLVCGLLAKKPEDRPFDAKMVANILGSVREKEEAQQSLGVEEAQKRKGDLAPDRAKPDEADKEAARLLLGGKVRRRRRKKKASNRQVYVQAAGLGLLLLGAVLTLFFALRSSPDKYYDEAARLWKSGKSEDREEAYKAISKYVERYAGSLPDDPRTKDILAWRDEYERIEDEGLLERYRKHRKGNLKVQAETEDQKKAFAAVEAECRGQLDDAESQWLRLEKGEQSRWARLARWHLDQIAAVGDKRKRLQVHYENTRKRRREIPLEGRDKEAFYALRCKWFGDYTRASNRFQKLMDDTEYVSDDHAWYLLAAEEHRGLRDKGEKSVSPAERAQKKLKDAETDFRVQNNVLDPKRTCLDIIALYEGDDEPDMVKVVEAAKRLKDEIEEKERSLGS
jgi:serine/threonine-protein kinase